MTFPSISRRILTASAFITAVPSVTCPSPPRPPGRDAARSEWLSSGSLVEAWLVNRDRGFQVQEVWKHHSLAKTRFVPGPGTVGSAPGESAPRPCAWPLMCGAAAGWSCATRCGKLLAMSNVEEFSRSPELMSAADTALLVVDVQGKLITLVPGHRRIIWNIRRLIDGANAGRKNRGHRTISQGAGADGAGTGRAIGARFTPRPRSAVARATRSWRIGRRTASAASCSPASRRTSAFSKRPTTCWRRDIACTWPWMRSALDMRSIIKRRCAAWIRPA